MTTHVWLRAEEKPGEQRLALIPSVASAMIDSGIRVTVERSPPGCIKADAFVAVGCEVQPAHSWMSAPPDTIILGLKELSESSAPLVHRHIHFAHVYKYQTGWKNLLQRFRTGGGQLYDLEYLVDEQDRRVAAFGYWAGYSGAAVALMGWAGQVSGAYPVMPAIEAYPSRSALLEAVQQALHQADRPPVVMVIGARGRSGCGAVELLTAAGVKVVAWDIEETRNGGPFKEILEVDILVNCVYVQKQIPPFITMEMLSTGRRQLTLICDVSCDPYGEYNPLPVYTQVTTFASPVDRLVDGKPPLDIISIDHLPSMLPLESSEDFVSQLAPHLMGLADMNSGVWGRARAIFEQKLNEL